MIQCFLDPSKEYIYWARSGIAEAKAKMENLNIYNYSYYQTFPN